MKKCPFCGYLEEDVHAFCSQCGKPLDNEAESAVDSYSETSEPIDAGSFFHTNPVLDNTKHPQGSLQQSSLQPGGVSPGVR